MFIGLWSSILFISIFNLSINHKVVDYSKQCTFAGREQKNQIDISIIVLALIIWSIFWIFISKNERLVIYKLNGRRALLQWRTHWIHHRKNYDQKPLRSTLWARLTHLKNVYQPRLLKIFSFLWWKVMYLMQVRTWWLCQHHSKRIYKNTK